MVVDPIDYDVDELREVSGGEFPDADFEDRVKENGFLWAEPSNRQAVGVEDPTPDQRARLAGLEGVDPSALDAKPYLESLPEGENSDEAALDWVEFLTETGGNDGALGALERYRELGWITEAVENDLRGYMLGVGRQEGEGVEAFDRTDHLLSFAYVARLAALDGQ